MSRLRKIKIRREPSGAFIAKAKSRMAIWNPWVSIEREFCLVPWHAEWQDVTVMNGVTFSGPTKVSQEHQDQLNIALKKFLGRQ